MIYRDILIIHESAVVRSLLNSYILSELSDIRISQAATNEGARELIASHKFNMIFSSQFLKTTAGVELFEFSKNSPINSQTPFVIFTSSGDQRNLSEIRESGVEHILLAPFQSADIRDLINNICDPKKLRTQSRFNIPETTACFALYNEAITAEIINISSKSILCEFSLNNHFIDVFKPLCIDVQFSSRYNHTAIQKIKCSILQYKALAMKDSFLPEKVQLVLIIKEMPEGEQNKWNETLEAIESDYQKWSEASV